MQEQTVASAEHSNSRISRKKKVLVATVVLMGISGAAIAYWTTTGSGDGTADTGDVLPVTIVQTSDVTGLAPGGAPQTLSGTVNNPNDGPVRVGTVTAEVSDVVDSTGTTVVGCDAGDYTIAGTGTVNADMPADDTGTWGNLTIQFNNSTTENQDACKNATVEIGYSVTE